MLKKIIFLVFILAASAAVFAQTPNASPSPAAETKKSKIVPANEGASNTELNNESRKAPKTEPKKSKNNNNDLILTVGAVLSFIQTGDSGFQEEMGGGQGYAEILRIIAEDVPELGTVHGLFDELAKAKEKERPAVAAKIAEVIKKTLNEEQKWHSLVGMHVGEVIFEFARLAKNAPLPAGERFDTSILESRLRLLNDMLTSVPAAASPDLVLRLRNIGVWANSKDLSARENLMGLLKATEEFIVSMIK